MALPVQAIAEPVFSTGAVLTYNSLCVDMQKYLNRFSGDFLSTIPTFIMSAQERLNRDLKILYQRKTVNGDMTPQNFLLSKPTDWASTVLFQLCVTSEIPVFPMLEYRPLEYIYQLQPIQNLGNVNKPVYGRPLYFSDFDNSTFALAPVPAAAYNFVLTYYAKPPLLSSDVQTNVFTQLAPNALLYACLLETASFLKDDERLAMWTTYYTTARDAIISEDSMRTQVGYIPNNH